MKITETFFIYKYHISIESDAFETLATGICDCVVIACSLESIRPGLFRVARPLIVWGRPAL